MVRASPSVSVCVCLCLTLCLCPASVSVSVSACVHRRGDPTRIGHVSEHPTFKFKSTGYSSDKYYFCSIKPWLEGDCRPRLTEWVGQCGVSGQWIKESKEGRSNTTENRSVFTSDECDDGDGDSA
jgi:hypothetical protein